MHLSNNNIAHLTSAHPRYDTRIFVKMCRTLANAGNQVSLVVADGKGNDTSKNVKIIDVGQSKGSRLTRMTSTVNRVFEAASQIDAKVYHLHDPELLQIAIKLKKLGKIVIFDAHEDLPKQILSKPYLNPLVAKTISFFAAKYEKYICSKIDGVIAATPFIRDKFLKINKNTVDINNFPLLEEFNANQNQSFERRKYCCYIGGITRVRGIVEIVQAISTSDESVTLLIAGPFLENGIKEEVEKMLGWKKVQYKGVLERQKVAELLGNSFAGLVTLHPIKNYLDALPVKMFEYMAAGIPIIYSDIPYWRSIVEPESCGIAVDPFDGKQLALAINYLYQNPKIAKVMGVKGREAVLSKYNWNVESKKLLQFYSKMLHS